MNYLVVDLGTGNGRVILVDDKGNIKNLKSFENRYYVDKKYKDAKYFIPSEWKEKIFNAIKEIRAENPNDDISAISSTGARQSIILYNKNGDFLGLPNIDNRGKEYLSEINSTKIEILTSKWFTEDFPSTKIYGFSKKYQKDYKEITTFTSLSEWIAEIFTNKLVITHTQACETLLYNIKTKNWDKTLCEKFNIDIKILPSISETGTNLGKINTNIQNELNLNECNFILGGADTQIGLYDIATQENIIIMAGTTTPIIRISDKINQSPFWTSIYFEDKYMVECNVGMSGLNYQKFKNNFFKDYSYKDLDDIILNKNNFKCIVHFTSLNFMDKKSKKYGEILSDIPLNFDKTDMLYSLVADMACSIYEQYKNLDCQGRIIGLGGGFQSRALSQMLCNLVQCEIVLPLGYEQSTVLGAVRIINKTLGIKNTISKKYEIFKPEQDILIHKYYKEWKKL